MIDADRLLDGPRGRELCLRVAMQAEVEEARRRGGSDGDLPLGHAFFCLQVGEPGTVFFEVAEPNGAPTRIEPRRTESDDLYRAPLARVPRFDPAANASVEVDPDDLPELLSAVVASARYWQSPDRCDLLLAEGRFRDALRPWADLIALMPQTHWWSDPIERSTQMLRVVEKRVPHEGDGSVREQLVRIADVMRRHEEVARHDLATAGHTSFGEWWSSPNACASTTRPWPGGRRLEAGDDVPVVEGGSTLTGTGRVVDALAGLLTEDAWSGPAEMAWRHVDVPRDARVLEIDSAQAWIDLCREAPLEVTALYGGAWAEWTQRRGPWVIPDWSRIAEQWDGVHLSLAAYLDIAGRTLMVDAERATLVAGWSPDETYWFIDGMGDGVGDSLGDVEAGATNVG